MTSTMCFVWKSQKKSKMNIQFSAKNVCGTDIKLRLTDRLTDTDENGEKTCQWLWTYWQFFFPFIVS